MFTFAILTGIYYYLIFAMGLLESLYREYIIFLTVIFFLIAVFIYKKLLLMNLLRCFKTFKSFDKLFIIFLALLFLQAIVNLIGVFGPELGFDALWYHLTLPKIYLSNHSVDFIPGGLLYYSAMPKLTEMLYVSGLALGNEIFAKLIHFSFGVLSLIALYKLSAKFFSMKLALLVCVIFYSNLVVGWLSVSAYIDLSRTFFEIMALWGFINFVEKVEPLRRFNLERNKWLAMSAIMLGLAISTKLLAIGSLLIFSVLILWRFWTSQNDRKNWFIYLLIYWFICLLIPLPWFIFSYINTGSFIYPFFTNTYPMNLNSDLINPIKFINDIWNIFTKSADPISPIYIVFLPVALFLFKKIKGKIRIVYVYSFLAILVWYITPRTGSGRFILPYLPAFSILVVYVLTEMKNISFRKIFIMFIIFISLFSIVYRFGANLKYIPVVFGFQSKLDFLTKNLNFSFGDFYDTDRYFERNIKAGDKVLLYGFHNLYYVNFPFIDSSFVKKGDEFNYIAVQNSNLPKRFSYWNRIYYNPTTRVELYSTGGQKWFY